MDEVARKYYVRCYPVFGDIWKPAVWELLDCKREPANLRDHSLHTYIQIKEGKKKRLHCNKTLESVKTVFTLNLVLGATCFQYFFSGTCKQ